jgi:hypothetical protein
VNLVSNGGGEPNGKFAVMPFCPSSHSECFSLFHHVDSNEQT